ncbi:MAG: ThiF family adenylyltransferase [Kiloniellaceae bacterium]
MSRLLISRNKDLKALLEDGYEVAINSGHLLLYNVPYVNADKQVKRGTLVSVLDLNGDETIKPKNHIAFFDGEHPCDRSGNKLRVLEHSSGRKDLGNGLVVHHSFSAKPNDGIGYRDYYHKMTTYAELISSPARAIDSDVSARTHIVVDCDDIDTPFNYVDSASTRAGIAAITGKLQLDKVGIIGLGGSGSYVLDLIAKTPVREIHLFDGDEFLQHNAFRSPAAPSLETLRKKLKKVEYFAAQYAPMRNGIIQHAEHIDEENLYLLDGMNFAFICIDDGEAKKPIAEALERSEVPFVDVGMGIYETEGSLGGVLRVTTSIPSQRDHFRRHVSFESRVDDDEYSQNIQIADLNALNAALAVIKWKKLFGFYSDFANEYSCHYTIDGNVITNPDG